MEALYKGALGALVIASLLAPFSAHAQVTTGVPFGGVVDAEIPCHIGPLPALWINVLGFDLIDVITAPPVGTIPFLYYVPVVGQFILGLADAPATCFIGLIPLPPGLRIQIFGTSGVPL